MAPTNDSVDERTLLLPADHEDKVSNSHEGAFIDKGFNHFKPKNTNSIKELYQRLFPLGYYSEFKATLSLSWAITWQLFTGFLLQPTAVIVAGRLGSIELDAVALSNTIINVCGYSIMCGLCTGIDTVFAQVYGSINRKQLGIHVQKSFIVLFLALMPSFAIFLNITSILTLLGQDPRVASMCGRYMLLFLPGLIFMWLYAVTNTYMRCQNIVRPQLVVGTLVAGIQIGLQYLLVIYLEWGIDGSSIALMLSYGLLFLFNFIYIIGSGIYKETWSGFSMQSFADWGDMCKLALSGMLMTCLEWWAFEISIILAGVIGVTELGAQSITLNLQFMLWALGGGFSIATCIRMGQLLGAGNPIQAVNAMRVGYTVLAAASIVGCTVMASLRYQLPAIFTNDEGVINLTASILPICAVYTFFDSIATMGRAITRGTGKQVVGTIICFIGHYIFALPIGVSLMFLTPLKTRGLWIGFAISLLINSGMFFIYTNFMSDYQKLSLEAQHRSGVKLDDIDVDSDSNEDTFPSKSHSDENDNENKQDNKAYPVITSKVMVRRVAAMAVFFGILIVGILCNLFIPDLTPNSGYIPNLANETNFRIDNNNGYIYKVI